MALQMVPSSLLNRHNYPQWRREVERIFEIEGLKPWLDKTTQPKVEGKSSIDDFRINQSKFRAIGLLKSFCTEELELEISNKNDPAEIWEHLENILQEPSRSLKSLYLAEFNNLKRQLDEEIPTFIARFEEAYRKVTNIGESVSEQHRCYKLLQCLDEGYDHIAREFENCDATKFLFSNLKDEVIKEYNRKKLRELNRPESFAVCTKEKLNENRTYRCNDCKKNQGTKPKTNTLPKNKNCTFISEFISESWISKDLTPRSRIWTLDSASNAHICQNLEFFVNMRDPPRDSTVRMGTTPHIIKGIGTVKFTIRDGYKTQTIVLKDALYVPSVHRNLISMARMDNAGYHAKLDRGFKIFSDKWRYLWCAKLKDNFYVVQGTPFPENLTRRSAFSENLNSKKNCNENFQVFLSENNLMLWHQRLGHCNLRTLKTMFDKNLIEPKLNLRGKEEKCEACIFGKNTRATYPKLTQVRSSDILELIHSDIWGPAPQTSKNGYRYILTFLDDYSRRLFCYPLRYKDEVFLKLKNFINFVERQTNKKVKAIRSDNGMEYCSRQVQNLLSDKGIRHERTNTYSPPQNGAAERANRILLEGTRTLLKSANLTYEFWLEALETVCYLRNRTLHSSINDIPFRRWYERKPSLRHLRRFGCVAYVHTPIQKRNKFEPKAKKGIFVGYSANTRGYKIFIPEENKIYESKHVTFNEDLLGNEQNFRPIRTLSFEEDDYTSSNRNYEQTYSKEEPEVKEEIDMLREKLEKLKVEDEEETKNEDLEFVRYTVKRKTGQSKGQEDIYVLTPEGTRLRSNQELVQYCKNHNLEFDNSLNIFSKYSTIKDTFTLRKLSSKQNMQNFESNCTDIVIPRNCKEALKSKEASHWKKAMDAEIDNMIKRNVWTPVPRTEKVNRVIGLKWVYTLKNKNKENKYKARLVALGNNQREGQDYYETYSPVVNFVLIRLFIILFICILNWKHSLLDVKCAYLYGNIDTDIYISQPNNYVIPGKEDHVLKLNRALYGLHQAGKCWHEELHNKLINNGFIQLPGMQCIYRYKNEAIIMVYVDDLPIFAKDESSLNKVIKLLESLYEVENLGPIKKLLGIEFDITEKGVFISCRKYIEMCMTNFDFSLHTKVSLPLQPGSIPSKKEQPMDPEQKDVMKDMPYRNLLGCLLYISGRCRPDVSFAVSSLAQMVENPAPTHWKKLVLVLKYLYSTRNLGLWMPADENSLTLAAYCDSSWASDPDTRRSWTGYSLFVNKAPVIWRVVKQTCVTLSPMESEFIAASEAAKDLKYLNSTISTIMNSMQLSTKLFSSKPILFCDNTAAIQFCKYEAENVRNRHIDIKYKFVRELYHENIFDIKYVRTNENVADLLTKSLSKEVFFKLRSAYLTNFEFINNSNSGDTSSTISSAQKKHCDHSTNLSEFQDSVFSASGVYNKWCMCVLTHES